MKYLGDCKSSKSDIHSQLINNFLDMREMVCLDVVRTTMTWQLTLLSATWFHREEIILGISGGKINLQESSLMKERPGHPKTHPSMSDLPSFDQIGDTQRSL